MKPVFILMICCVGQILICLDLYT